MDEENVFSFGRQVNNIFIKVTLFSGRNKETKLKLYDGIEKSLKSLDAKISVITVLEEISKENFGIDNQSADNVY